jgi:hypothetical protein
MSTQLVSIDSLELLVLARRVADYAFGQGVSQRSQHKRDCYTHIGALLADSILQAGMNYNTVVRPRINRILKYYPHASTVDVVVKIIKDGGTSDFLDWKHPVKAKRFEQITFFMHDSGIFNIDELRLQLQNDNFREYLQTIHGVGPKTIDYMACLIGIDSIAVDRHIKAFAKRAGLNTNDYYNLKYAFCYAADLLLISRRDFDAWIWQQESQRSAHQLRFDVQYS